MLSFQAQAVHQDCPEDQEDASTELLDTSSVYGSDNIGGKEYMKPGRSIQLYELRIMEPNLVEGLKVNPIHVVRGTNTSTTGPRNSKRDIPH